MRATYTCSLNGIELESLDHAIHIEDIHEQAKIDVSTDNRFAGGRVLTAPPRRESLEITIKFKIKTSNRHARQLIMNDILGWATEGWLLTSLRENQRIYVYCTSFPGYGNWDRTESFDITFTAYYESAWREITPAVATTIDTSGTADLIMRGNRASFLEAEVKNNSDTTVTTVTLAANGCTITFSGLSLARGDVLNLYYDEHFLLCAKVGNTSVLSKRTAASSDTVKLNPGKVNTVSYSANAECEWTLIGRGLYL